VDFVGFILFLAGVLAVLSTIAGLWSFIAPDTASAGTRMLVLVGIGVVAIAVAPFVWPTNGEDPTGQIISPASGDEVGHEIEARGVLADISEEQHVWVVVRDGNLLYPQDTEITPSDGEWSLIFRQGGVSESISLELYLMGAEGSRFINKRLAAGDFSGVPNIPGAVRLDAVENLRIRG
jgi:hypothetical protein